MQATSTNFKTTIAGNDIITEVKVTITLPIVRRNVCPNPKSAYSTYGWVSSHGEIPFLFIARNGTGVVWASGAPSGATLAIPIATQPGNTYTASAPIEASSGGSTGVMLAAVGIATSSVQAADNAFHATSVTFVATGYITLVGLQMNSAPTAGSSAGIETLLVEQSAAAGSYFDGDTTGASWDGIPGQSTSSLAGGPYPDVSASVESIDVDRELTTDLPDGTKSVTGYPAAGATVVLSGLMDQTDATKTAAWFFNPYSTDSPLYRNGAEESPIVIEAGVANKTPSELVPLLTGVISKVTVDMQAGTVTIECVDNRGKLRAASAMPGIGATMQVQNPGATALVTMTPGLSGLWPLDYLLRANGIYASTGPRPGCAFYASMCGGAWPQICGTVVMAQADQSNLYNDEINNLLPMQFVAGNWTPQICRDASHACSLAVPIILNGTGNGWHCEFGLNGTPPAATVFTGGIYQAMSVTLGVMAGGSLSNTTFWSLIYVSGTTWAFKANDTTAHNVTISAAEHVVDVQVNGAVFTLLVDGVQLGQWTSANTPASVTANYVQTVLPYPVEALQVTAEPNGTPRTIPTPAASFDPSLNTLVAIPDPGTSDEWQIIQELAQAEGAIDGFDETGLFTSTNRQSLGSGASVRTITSASSLKGLQTEQDTARLATHITLPIDALQRGTWAPVWSGQGNRVNKNGIYYLPAHATDTLLATWTDPAVIGTIAGVVASGGINPTQPKSGYRAAKAADGSGGAISNLVVTVVQTSPVSATITITNPNAFTAYFVQPPGYPTAQGTASGFALAGATWTTASAAPDAANDSPGQLQADSQWPPADEGGAVTNQRYGEKVLNLPSNPWVQDQGSAQAFTDDLLAELYKVKPQWVNAAMVADPSQQLADRVTVVDPDASQISDDAILARIQTKIDAASWDQDVDMRAVSTPGGWIMGQVGRSEMGVATYA